MEDAVPLGSKTAKAYDIALDYQSNIMGTKRWKDAYAKGGNDLADNLQFSRRQYMGLNGG